MRWPWSPKYEDCEVCGATFRSGRGGGVSGTIVCSNTCWGWAWVEFMKGNAEMRRLREQEGLPNRSRDGV